MLVDLRSFSFKRGRVVSISHKVATDGVFNSYEALRKHWKVMVSLVSQS